MSQPIVNTADQFFTGTGILLQGDPFRANGTGFGGIPLKGDRVEYFIAVGFPKDQPAATLFNDLWQTMNEVAKTHKFWASYAPANGAGFHWKLEDGDLPQHVNKPGWKGCYVIKFKNGFQPQVFDENRNAVPSPYIDNIDPATGKIVQQMKPGVAHPFPCGHYVRVMCSIKCNESAPPQSGIYINFHMVQRVGYGTPIYSGPDYTEIMGSQAAALPGMSSMPVGGNAPAMAAPAGGGVGVPPVGSSLPAAPGAAAGPAAGPAVETPQSRMIDQQFTYDQYIQAGYTEEGMIAQGLMRPAAVTPPAPGAVTPPAAGGLPPAPGAVTPPAAGGLPPAPGGGGLPGMPPAAGGLPPVGHQYNQ